MDWIHLWIGFGRITVTSPRFLKLVITARRLTLFLTNNDL